MEWRVDTGARIWASAAVADGTVFVGNDAGVVYAIDRAAGTVRWCYRVRDAVVAPAAVTYSTVYVADRGGAIYGLSKDPD